MNEPISDPHTAWLNHAFREFERPLMSYATHLMGDADRASDVVQDTFVRLCRQPQKQIEHCVRQWLYTVCRNRALDVLKKETRMKVMPDVDQSSKASRDGDPQLIAQQKDSAKRAESLMDRLPSNQQEVIRLKVEADMSYREIADITGLTVSNVGYLLHTGLKSIRKQLATEGSV